MKNKQMIYEGRLVHYGEEAIQLQHLYIEQDAIYCENVRVQASKEVKKSRRPVSKNEAYALAKANYLETVINYSENEWLGEQRTTAFLETLHKRAMKIGGVTA